MNTQESDKNGKKKENRASAFGCHWYYCRFDLGSPDTGDEKRKYRMLSIITYILFTAIAIAISNVFYYISVCMMITMLSIIVLMIIPVIQNHLWNNPKFF